LATYDSCDLWLPKHLAAELVTLDRKLFRASAAPG
jgi:predicted nucleic acid-binding protein